MAKIKKAQNIKTASEDEGHNESESLETEVLQAFYFHCLKRKASESEVKHHLDNGLDMEKLLNAFFLSTEFLDKHTTITSRLHALASLISAIKKVDNLSVYVNFSRLYLKYCDWNTYIKVESEYITGINESVSVALDVESRLSTWMVEATELQSSLLSIESDYAGKFDHLSWQLRDLMFKVNSVSEKLDKITLSSPVGTSALLSEILMRVDHLEDNIKKKNT